MRTLGLVSLASTTVCSSFELSFVTWNTMQYADAYDAQWGTPSESIVASELAREHDIPLSEARDIRSSLRFDREAERIREWQSHQDIIALQEVEFTHEHAVRLIDKVQLETSEWQPACPLPLVNATSTFATPLMLRRDRFVSISLLSNGITDVPGCIAEAVARDGPVLVVGSVHAKSGPIRADARRTVEALLEHLDDVVGKRSEEYFIVLGGDWNAHIYDLLPIFKSSSKSWRAHTVQENSTMLLSLPRFTSQHEHNWLAAYDGWFIRAPRAGPSYHALSVEIREGFLPKYLSRGKHSTHGDSPFYFDGCRHGPDSGSRCRMTGALNLETQDEIWKFPHCRATAGLSDHMALQMDFRFATKFLRLEVI
ncbi:hypothetical protein FOZ60_007044 [Perkinsus olseni]|uniref:Endonuclease/exonuclease/phosphatase domain-containing protein n=1 Tax=Perkinsus olseni TaxID=32597 RepID=A0A7J6NMU9_PEROL|nr:hypothetical protein FOZ60_007044 [Perkinsus olseni]